MMGIPIIYEDERILALNKPAGVSVHGGAGERGETVADWILRYYPKLEGVGEDTRDQKGNVIKRPGIVHRLDKDTSGVLVVAKNQKTFEYLKGLFQTKSAKKIYEAVVYGEVKEREGVIESPLVRSKTDFRKRAVAREGAPDARAAKTRFRVLKRFKGYTHLELYPETGRMHQLRVHLKSMGHAIVCDKLYAAGRACPGGIARQTLHATRITLPGPGGTSLSLEAERPRDFEDLLAALPLL